MQLCSTAFVLGMVMKIVWFRMAVDGQNLSRAGRCGHMGYFCLFQGFCWCLHTCGLPLVSRRVAKIVEYASSTSRWTSCGSSTLASLFSLGSFISYQNGYSRTYFHAYLDASKAYFFSALGVLPLVASYLNICVCLEELHLFVLFLLLLRVLLVCY